MTPDQLARPWLAARNAAIGEGQRRAWADAEKRASRLKAIHATRRRNRRNPDFEVSDNGWWKQK